MHVRVLTLTLHQRGHGHQRILLNAPGASGALEHPQQRRHHYVGDLQRILMLHLTQDILQGDTSKETKSQGITVTIRA